MRRTSNQANGADRGWPATFPPAVPALWSFLIAALFLGAASSPWASAQTNTAKPALSNRWLFVVETSKHMEPRARAAGQTAASLVWSGANGQMRPGDTLGIWTFNDDVYAGRFPLQIWSPGTRQETSAQMFQFLNAQKFEKDSRLDNALGKMLRIIRNSDYITVVLVSDGSKKIHGTPFDDQINRTYRSWSKEQEKALIPFVTVLRAEHGRITHYAVAMPPWPIEMPPLPAALTQVAAVTPPAEHPPIAAPRIVPSLIVHGTESKPAAAQSPGTDASTPQPPAVAVNALPVQARAPATAPAAAVTAPGAAPIHPATTVATAAQGGILSRGSLWVASAALMVLVFGVVILLMRKSRSTPRISVVTRSLDRRDES
ncbi:MAG: hypothetical protein ABSA69_06305 [Verrucomicrobiota bacterium]|jgi:hypothetical protein